MNCENCQNEHEGTYGSGRFCSSKCARGFSTKEKRKEINNKVSNKIKNKLLNRETVGCCKIINFDLQNKLFIECNYCKREFETKRKKRKFCSRECSNNMQKGKPKKGNYSNNGGIREGGGRSKSLEYINHLGESMKLNKEEISVAIILDKFKLNWNRNWKSFIYEDIETSKIKKFYPDFYIKDFDLYLEYKGWLTDSMRHKMKDAKLKNDFNLLIVVGEDKRFSSDGLIINDLEKFIHEIQSR